MHNVLFHALSNLGCAKVILLIYYKIQMIELLCLSDGVILIFSNSVVNVDFNAHICISPLTLNVGVKKINGDNILEFVNLLQLQIFQSTFC